MENSSKQHILNKLRSAKNYGTKYQENVIADKSNPFLEPEENLVLAFKSALEKISGICHAVDSIESAEAIIRTIAQQKNCNTIFATANVSELLPTLRNELCTNDAPVNENPLSISTCECLSARTGSVAVSSKTSNGRQLHAFAETHIVVAFENQMYPDVPEALAHILDTYNHDLPSAITFITGQSRTADIEKTLILGAHGPKELIVIIIKQ